MNVLKSRTAVASVIGQWRRHLVETGSRRRMCNKPENVKMESPPAPSAAPAERAAFRLPGYRPSNLDRKILVWSGRFKTAEQIPQFVSFEMIDAARNKMRVKACYGMMGATIGACLLMVFLGKRATARHESLSEQNMEKKVRWREEWQKEREDTAATAAVSKAQ